MNVVDSQSLLMAFENVSSSCENTVLQQIIIWLYAETTDANFTG